MKASFINCLAAPAVLTCVACLPLNRWGAQAPAPEKTIFALQDGISHCQINALLNCVIGKRTHQIRSLDIMEPENDNRVVTGIR